MADTMTAFVKGALDKGLPLLLSNCVCVCVSEREAGTVNARPRGGNHRPDQTVADACIRAAAAVRAAHGKLFLCVPATDSLTMCMNVKKCGVFNVRSTETESVQCVTFLCCVKKGTFLNILVLLLH
ncbi:hypothetical protein CHARACLAT_015185 [Characodon lateralis]|uniref:Uncharacterized protein n=1 Tax=Characodon lateralis TaxID=208331 RepID=A0ABU7CYF9_9TELE|nr:hypothetical protein [Characodon lateralis]